MWKCQKINDVNDCKILCKDCNICPHIYSCTCLDATLHATVCKHIHLVHMETNSGYNSSTTEVDYSYFNNVLSPRKKTMI